ncbi:MAG TPA: DUF433 domain-containing protein [Nitrospiria bacterium]|nr:DUF433 domain-containing protein [Nitrospiria bacterium]
MSKTAASPKKNGETGTFARIVRDKSIMHGQPTIKGTRIPVSLIFDYLADGYSIKDILDRFPHLTPEDINEALRYGSNALQR